MYMPEHRAQQILLATRNKIAHLSLLYMLHLTVDYAQVGDW